MSFDPLGHPPELASSPAADPAQTVSGPAAGSPAANAEAAFRAARERVFFPAMLVIALGIINLLLALFQTGGLVYLASQPAERMKNVQLDAWEKMAERIPAFRQAAEEIRKKEPDKLKQEQMLSNGPLSAVLLVVALVGLVGGVRMLQLRSYALAMLGSITTALPCLSLSGCCCGIGQLVGLWAVFVLLSIDVRIAFR